MRSRGAIVNEDELEAIVHLFHHGLEPVVQGGDVLFFVMKGDNDGVLRHGCDDTPSAMAFPGK